MKKLAVATALAATLAVAGCGTVSYAPYEGRDNVYEGKGGTKVTQEGIDFWTYGTPPRRYAIIGIVSTKASEGEEGFVKAKVLKEAKAHNADAVITLSQQNVNEGTVIIPIGTMAYGAPAYREHAKLALVRYLD